MVLFPAIDILDGRVVRLEKGDFNRVTIYNESAFEQAKTYNKFGFDWVHIVDLMGSKTGEISILEEIKKIKKSTDLKIELGGGVRSEDDVKKIFDAGTDRVIIGSLSVKNKNLFEKIVSNYGNEKIVVASDVLNEKIAIKGWTEQTDITIDEHIEYCKSLGLKYFLTTDISKDGMLTGPSFDLYNRLQHKYPDIKLYASGGISSFADLVKLKNLEMYGAIVGKAIYENKINLEDLKKIA